MSGEIIRHATVFGHEYSWAILKDNHPDDYLFTEDPTFEGPSQNDIAITKEEFESVWLKAEGPVEPAEGS